MQRARYARRAAWFVVGALLISVGIVGVLRVPFFHIATIRVSGAETIDPELIERTVEKELSGSYAFVVPRKHAFFYPKAEISRKLLEQFSDIATTSLAVTDRGLDITITEYRPAYVYCPDHAARECYYASSDGYIFRPAPYFLGSLAYLKWVGGVSVAVNSATGTSILRSRILPQEDFARALDYSTGISEILDEPIDFVENIGDGDYRARLRGGYDVMIHIKDDPDRALENLALALTAEDFRSKRQDSGNVLESIDLRFGDKIFYTFKTREETLDQ